MFVTVDNYYMANALPPFMGNRSSGAKNYKNVRIYLESWEKVIGEGKMYETFADVLDRMLDELLAMKGVSEEHAQDAVIEDLGA